MRTEAQKRWYLDNRERARETQRNYERANPDKVKAWLRIRYDKIKANRIPKIRRPAMSKEDRLRRKREYYYANKEEIIAKQRHNPSKKSPTPEQRKAHVLRTLLWGKNNPDKVKAIASRYRKNNCEALKRKQLPITRMRRARIANVLIGDPKVIAKWEFGWRKKKKVKCFWCRGRFKPRECHVDHINPVSKGGEHSIGNLVIACAGCNLSKHASLINEWNKRIAQPVLL